tara:strand:- start:7268 stop:8044 length:777 start_codon:yes stop_codon:yes gene_type:complete
MTSVEIDSWLAKSEGELFVSEEYFHHHAYEIMNAHNSLRSSFKTSLTSTVSVQTRVKRTKEKRNRGIEAGHLNKEIRRLLCAESNKELKLEVSESKGVFYFSSVKNAIGGFDFAIINHRKNLNALRNLCFGELQYHDGLKRWNKFLEKNTDLKETANQIIEIHKNGNDIAFRASSKDSPLVVGEIQFGNWALAYRDFFKVLKANVQNNVDCLIYVVPTGNLESMLSDGIVTYEKTKAILKDFAKVISVPVWVVGLDVK